MLDVISINPWFWDAYLELEEMITDENINDIEMVGGLEEYFYMHLFCNKMILKKN